MSFFSKAVFKSFSLRSKPFVTFLLGKEAFILLKLTLIAGGKSTITYFTSSLIDSITLAVLPAPAPTSKNLFFLHQVCLINLQFFHIHLMNLNCLE